MESIETHGPDRAAGAALLGGAALLLIGNTLHPIDSDPTPLSRLDLATGTSWIVIHLVIAAGVLAVTAGLVIFARSRKGTAASLVGAGAIIGGGAMGIVFAALDGYGMATLAERWNAVSQVERVDLEGAAIALDAIDTGLAGFGTLLLMGLSMVAAATLARRSLCLLWLPRILATVGILGVLSGTAMLVTGATPTTINILLRPTALAFTASMVVLGVQLRGGLPWRRGDRESMREPAVSEV